jgi:argininosuccinate lyase
VDKNNAVAGVLWGGRFDGGPSKSLENISRSWQFDIRLAKYDILGSIAHARALNSAGILQNHEFDKIEQELRTIQEEILAGSLMPTSSDEDVHGFLERILIERVGVEIGGKLRAGRSRNDQIAAIIRMYLLDSEVQIRKLMVVLLEVIKEQATKAFTGLNKRPVIMPGRTHLQHAQPVLLTHHLLAHGWALLRDLQRLIDWKVRAKYSTYGASALVGDSLGLDENAIAKELGFNNLEPNSVDATASRDVVAEFAFILSLIAINLSRFAEELILWNTKEFDFVKLDDAYSTGSSIMPQKKNPDISELTRGKSGRIIGNLTGLLTTLKGLPLAYNRDLQEDKEPVFDSIDQLLLVLPAFAGQLKTANFNYEKMQSTAGGGFALATDIANWLVKRGVPFRIAHELAGECVRLCEQRQTTGSLCADAAEYDLKDLEDADFEEILGAALAKYSVNKGTSSAAGVREVLSIEDSAKSRTSFSGTAPSSVSKQLINFIKKINNFR